MRGTVLLLEPFKSASFCALNPRYFARLCKIFSRVFSCFDVKIKTFSHLQLQPLFNYVELKHLRVSKSYVGTVGISVIIVFVVLCLLVGATFIVRKHRQQILRSVHLQIVTPVRYNHNETVGLVLPSYEEVQKIKSNPPPTFEEIFGLEGMF